MYYQLISFIFTFISSKKIMIKFQEESYDENVFSLRRFRDRIASVGLKHLSEELKLRQVTAILIHPPEHLTSDGTLLGHQQMRHRHMQVFKFLYKNYFNKLFS